MIECSKTKLKNIDHDSSKKTKNEKHKFKILYCFLSVILGMGIGYAISRFVM